MANTKVAGELLRRIVVASHKFRLFLSQVLPAARLNRPLDKKGGLLLARHVSKKGNWLLPIPCVVRQVNRLQQESMTVVSKVHHTVSSHVLITNETAPNWRA